MRSSYPDAFVIRPARLLTTLLLMLIAGMALLIVAGAFRTGQPLVAWFGVAMLIGAVPLGDWYFRSIAISALDIAVVQALRTTAIRFDAIQSYGLRGSWSYRSGQWTYLTILGPHRRRIDLPISLFVRADVSRLLSILEERAGPPAPRMPRPPIDWLAGAAIFGALATVGMSMLVTSILLPPTVSGERLFSEGAAAGAVIGFLLGAALGRAIRRVPLAVAALASVMLLAAFGSGALAVNATAAPAPGRTVPVTVNSRHSFVDRGRTVYVVDLDVAGARKRLQPNEAGWQRLNEARSFDGCVRDGRLGFPIIVQLTHACRATVARR
jgi:hypothetical protein